MKLKLKWKFTVQITPSTRYEPGRILPVSVIASSEDEAKEKVKELLKFYKSSYGLKELYPNLIEIEEVEPPKGE